jgi:hypothetical protein
VHIGVLWNEAGGSVWRKREEGNVSVAFALNVREVIMEVKVCLVCRVAEISMNYARQQCLLSTGRYQRWNYEKT